MKFLMLLLTFISFNAFARDDPRRDAYLSLLNEQGYQAIMPQVVNSIQKSLPITGSPGVVTFNVNFIGTALIYKASLDLDAFNKAYGSSFDKSYFQQGGQYESFYVGGRIDSFCRNDMLRPAMKMGMHVVDIVLWGDTFTQVYRVDVAESDCIRYGL